MFSSTIETFESSALGNYHVISQESQQKIYDCLAQNTQSHLSIQNICYATEVLEEDVRLMLVGMQLQDFYQVNQQLGVAYQTPAIAFQAVRRLGMLPMQHSSWLKKLNQIANKAKHEFDISEHEGSTLPDVESQFNGTRISFFDTNEVSCYRVLSEEAQLSFYQIYRALYESQCGITIEVLNELTQTDELTARLLLVFMQVQDHIHLNQQCCVRESFFSNLYPSQYCEDDLEYDYCRKLNSLANDCKHYKT